MQTINHYITYSVITSSPELTYSSVLSTVRLYPVTSGELEGSTFVEWSGNFSSDADAGKFRLISTPPLRFNLVQRSAYWRHPVSRERDRSLQTCYWPHTDNLSHHLRGHPRRQIQAPRGSRRSRQGSYEEINRQRQLHPTRKRTNADAAVGGIIAAAHAVVRRREGLDWDAEFRFQLQKQQLDDTQKLVAFCCSTSTGRVGMGCNNHASMCD